MRGAILIAILAAGVLFTTAGAASGDANGVVASASGGYSLNGTAAGSTFEIQPFTFNVRIYADGSVEGRFNYTQVRDGGEPLVVKGSLDCAVIQGNQAWVGGVIEETSARACSASTCGSRCRTTASPAPTKPGHVVDAGCRRPRHGRPVLRRLSSRAVPVLPRRRQPAGAARRLGQAHEGRDKPGPHRRTSSR